MDYFELREKFNNDIDILESVKDLKNYKDYDRKGHEAYLYVTVTKGNTGNSFDSGYGFQPDELKKLDKAMSKIKNMHIASFEGGEKGPKGLDFRGDMSSLKKILTDRDMKALVKKYKARVTGPYNNDRHR